METQHIGYVRCVAAHGNISAAARELGMTQPALTKIVCRVEDLVGVQIFDRGSRGVSLTPFGDLFLRRMEKVENELHNLAEEIRSQKHGISGTVSLGVGQFWLGRILPSVIAKLSLDSPDIRVRIRTGPREELLLSLKNGDLDYILGRVAEDLPEGITGEQLAEVRLFLVARADHPLTHLGRSVTAEDIAQYGWVLPDRADQTIQYAFTDYGLDPPVSNVETVSQHLIIALLQETDFVTIMPDITVSQLSKGLVGLPADWLSWSGNAGLFSVKDRTLLPCCERFVSLLRREMKSLSHVS